MSILKRKKILVIILIAIMTLFLNIKITYARNTYYDSIVGYAYEDSNELYGIANIIVNLYNSEYELVATTKTDENGKYEFKNLSMGNYTVDFEWGVVSDEEIDNVKNTDEAKKIQNIIKYNGQDYSSQNYGHEETNVQISLVIDKSAYITEEKMEQTKELAINLVDYLLDESAFGDLTNVEVNLISFSDKANVETDFTNDIDKLTSKIENINPSGNNRTLEALELASSNNKFKAENRFIFFVTNGMDSENRIQEIKDYVTEVRDSGIKIYSLYMGDDAYTNSVESCFEDVKFENINEIQLKDVIEDLTNETLNYVQVSLGYGEVIENEIRREEIDNFFSSFSYNNTIFFSAIDMNVTGSNMSKFKQYAKLLTAKAGMTGYSNKICRITEKRDEHSKAIVFPGPNLKLRLRPNVNIQQLLYVTGMRITSQTGSVIGEKRCELGEKLPLIESKEPEELYGATLELEYTLAVRNNSNIENSGFSEITFFSYLPAGFVINNDSTDFINENNGSTVNSRIIQITRENINTLTDFYQDIDLNELQQTNLYNEIVNNNKNAVLIMIEYENDTVFKYNDYFIIKFVVSKLLTGEENEQYQERSEIFKYSNESNRRMMTVGNNSSGEKQLIGLTAGNGIKGERDTVEFSNLGIIIPPTGGDKRNIGIYIIIGILLIIQIAILMKIRKCKNKVD